MEFHRITRSWFGPVVTAAHTLSESASELAVKGVDELEMGDEGS